MKNYNISSDRVIYLSALFLLAFANMAFFSNVTDVYPPSLKNIGFLISLAFVFFAANVFLLSFVCFRYTLKPLIISIFMVSSLAAYFMDSYNVIIDDSMINNIMETNVSEASDLFSVKMVFYFLFMGLLPSYLLYKVQVVFKPAVKELLGRLKMLLAFLLGALVLIWLFSNFYSSFFREHKPLRFYANPSYYIYSTGKFIRNKTKPKTGAIKAIGLDAKIPETDPHRELVIFVLGETARHDRFSLNGYERETNPLLKHENVISLTNFWSCGTSTAISVPCMFSLFSADEFDIEKGREVENVLDVLNRAGVNILWLDNNSDSKGVADRVTYVDYKKPEVNPVCDLECRDEGMLHKLQEYIDGHRQGDIFVVLHQMGSHGPAYFKRYPDKFRQFLPDCQTNQLEDCTPQEIGNSYDNTILYTDYFLSKTIELLKRNGEKFEAAMFYASDHGESLGESGVYLHGLPNMIAPDDQRHIPVILWIGENFDEDDFNLDSLRLKKDVKYSHDNIFHTLLGFMEIETAIYDRTLDILHHPIEEEGR